MPDVFGDVEQGMWANWLVFPMDDHTDRAVLPVLSCSVCSNFVLFLYDYDYGFCSSTYTTSLLSVQFCHYSKVV